MDFSKHNIITILYISFIFTLLGTSYTARILGICPIPMRSFLFYNEAIMKVLHSAGHHITFISPFHETEKIENYTVINIQKEHSPLFGETKVDHFSSMSTRKFAKVMIDVEDKFCNEVAQLKVIQEALAGTVHYDIMFIGMIQMYECYLYIAEKLQIPVIGTINYRSWGSERLIGNPFNPAIVPLVWTSHGKTMNFYQRLMNTWNIFLNDFLYYYVVAAKLSNFVNIHFPNDTKNFKGVTPALIFINSHLTLQPRAMVPNAIEIAGIHIKPKKPLPKEISDFINEAEHGVILFSFGSVVKTNTLSPQVISIFVNAFSRIRQRVVWKFEESIQGISDNVLLSSWIPQRDILEHQNVKAFISHCGLSGIYEAIYAAVPIIASPFFCDQRSNAALLFDLGVAVPLDLNNVTEQTVLFAINSIINDTGFAEKMKSLSSIFRDRPMSPQEIVVYWTEYVLKYKSSEHLLTAAASMPLYQYLLLDIFSFIVALITITLTLCYYLINKIISYVKKLLERKDVKMGLKKKS